MDSTLAWSLRHRIIMIVICVLVFLSTIPIAAGLGVNLVPRDDQSEFQVTYITAEGYTLERTNQVLAGIESRLSRLPGVLHHFTIIGQNTGTAGKGQGDVTRGSIYFRIKEISEREYSQFDVMAQAREILHDYPDLRTAVSDVSAIGVSGQDSRTFQISIQGPDLDKLASYSADFITQLRLISGIGRCRFDALAPHARSSGRERSRPCQRPWYSRSNDCE